MKLRFVAMLIGAVTAAACGPHDSSVTKDDGTSDSVEENDDAPPAGSDEVFVGAVSGEFVEGGASVTVPIKLSRQPGEEVEVHVVAIERMLFSADPQMMTFTPETWRTSQTLTLQAFEDVIDADRNVTVELSLVSGDESFGGRPVEPLVLELLDSEPDIDPGNTDNNVPDNNDPGATPELIVESVAGFFLQEGGEPLEVRARLSSRPTAEVLVPVSIDDDTEAVIDATSFSFSTTNWSEPRAMLLRGIDDLQSDGDQPIELAFGPLESADSRIDGARLDLEFTVVDGNCGNGVVDGDEVCEPDESASPTCEYGDQSCTVCTATCDLTPGEGGGWCGDGIIQSAHEECDEPREECAYGEESCVTCDACEEVAGTVTGYCGDGVINGPEQCDGGECCTSSCTEDPSCGAGCLMISEYLEGTSYNKAVEIYNCDSVAINLERYELCLARDADADCSKWYDMQGSIQPGQARVVCNQNVDADLFGYCDWFEAHATSFNGDDRLFIYYDEDNNGSYDPGDTIVDAFGEIATQPAAYPWAEVVYDRCDLATYAGTGAWSASDYFALSPHCTSTSGCTFPDAYAGLGVAPVAGCP